MDKFLGYIDKVLNFISMATAKISKYYTAGKVNKEISPLLDKYKDRTKDPLTIVMEANKGIGANTFFDLVDLSSFPKAQLAGLLHTSVKTLVRYRQEKKKLNPILSEQTLKLIGLFKKGSEVFSNTPSFKRWLEKPAYGLGNQVPLELLQTSGGIDLVQEELIRIEYGDLA